MNRQVGYIIYAHLILAVTAVFLLFIKNISVPIVKQKNEILYTTVNHRLNSSLTENAKKGKFLFMSKCASCHNLFKDATGPSILGFEERGPWTDRRNVYAWIHNPSAFMKNDLYTQKLKSNYGVMMTGFPDLSSEEIDAICDYINQVEPIRYGIPIAGK